MAKTRDGLRIGKVLRALEQLKGVTIRTGKNHPYIAYKEGYAVLCPVAESTDARKMIVPWIKNAIGYSDPNNIYKALKTGGWN